MSGLLERENLDNTDDGSDIFDYLLLIFDNMFLGFHQSVRMHRI